MKHSDTLNELPAALSKAQSEMSGAKKTAKNPFFKSNYANLEEVIHCIKEPFSDNGLSFMQFPITQDGFAGVETIILHKSGEWVSNEFMLKCAKNDPQGMGSAITYARRYGLQAACGVPSEDDDCNEATQSTPPPKKKPSNTPPKAAAKEGITDIQHANLKKLKEAAKMDDKRFREGVMHVSGKLTDIAQNLTERQAASLIGTITKIIESNKNTTNA